MQTRRQFLKNAALLSGSAGFWGALVGPVRRAMGIEPVAGSTYLDAEHVVILMQENRSFDHAFGTLRGVRGYNDPRAITLPNGDPVWVQSDAKGKRYCPFRLNIKDTRVTWMGSLPHTWSSQVDARNHGRHDHWLRAKRSGQKDYAEMPLTLGHYTREDIPLYYALADAFTICDQHFCSSITPTMPNRLYFWTGTVRAKPSVESPALVRNDQIEKRNSMNWTTFPERLEDHGISWKVYQNEVTVPSGLVGEADAWLSNFGCNVFEYFSQFHVEAHALHRQWVLQQEKTLPDRIAAARKALAETGLGKEEADKRKKHLNDLLKLQKSIESERSRWDANDFEKLSRREKSLHERAFCSNSGDASYRELAQISFKDGQTTRQVQVPRGDVFHQFREDVRNGKLPTVSWLIAPERLSDHPESAWYGAWYVSETLRILTENPEIWKKTIFILTYDENDGYFDHVPPFVAPHPRKRETGFTSREIDASLDYIELEQDARTKFSSPRESPIGLGYRVPMVIASPWSRGGCVCSQVFDSTSVLQFLETFLSKKTGKAIMETNISSWRRAICGDLTSAFQLPSDKPEQQPAYLARDPFVKQIYQAKFKPLPPTFTPLSDAEVEAIARDPKGSPRMSQQEPGVRRSAALPYELYVHGGQSADGSRFTIEFAAGNKQFGERSAGAPFTVYARGAAGEVAIRNYAVSAGDQIEDSWALADFANRVYHLQVYGPNGFYREFTGGADDPRAAVGISYGQSGGATGRADGNLDLIIANHDLRRPIQAEIADQSYGGGAQKRSIMPGERASVTIDTGRSHQWYDLSVTIEGAAAYRQRFAGRVETGEWTMSDPAMGRVEVTDHKE
ncbi:MAG TPA: phospholipase C, phosphocholine-specific [Tepidisphaeraceae bacterium]